MSKTTAKAKKATATAPTATDYAVILAPVITEKSTNVTAHGQYTFRVSREATKPVIKTAIERLFNVKVTDVNTHNRKGKTKRFKGRVGFRSDIKIAIVTLAEGNTIDMQTGV
jgi:large subunit ribosomal protein L23